MNDVGINIKKISGKNAAVYCDVDGTLSRSNIVEPLVWVKMKLLKFPLNFIWFSTLFLLCPYWIILDRFSRRCSNISIYKQYKNLPAKQVRELAEVYYEKVFRKKIFKQALNVLTDFKNNGYRVVFVSGGIDIFLEPFAKELNADCIAISLLEFDGVFTGNINGEPLTGKLKANFIKQHSLKNNIDLNLSYAMGDASGDLEMLECVGNPVAVNPDSRLRKIALSRGWKIVKWNE